MKRIRTWRRALTLPELMLGLAMTATIGLAAAVLSNVGTAGLANSDQSAAAIALNRRTGSFIDTFVSNSLYVAQVASRDDGDAADYVFLWRRDGFGGADDSLAQAGEMALLEYDPVNQVVCLFIAKPEAAMNVAERAAAWATNWGDLSDPAVVAWFKSQSFLAAPRTIGLTPAGGQIESFEVKTRKPAEKTQLVKFKIDSAGSEQDISFVSHVRNVSEPLNAGG